MTLMIIPPAAGSARLEQPYGTVQSSQTDLAIMVARSHLVVPNVSKVIDEQSPLRPACAFRDQTMLEGQAEV